MDSDKNNEESTSTFRVTIADGLRPLIKINYLLGVSTFIIDSSGHIQHPYKIFNRCRGVLAILFIFISACMSCYRVIETLLWNPIYESPNGAFGRFNKMVELICQFTSNVFPAMLIFIGLFRSSEITRFFQQMSVYNAGICEFADPKRVSHVTRRLIALHMVMIIFATGVLQFRLFTFADPTELEWRQKFKEWTLVGRCVDCFLVLGVAILAFLKLGAIAFLECFNMALATCFSKVIENLSIFISEQADKWKISYLGMTMVKLFD